MRADLKLLRVRYGHWLLRLPVCRRVSGVVLYPYVLFRDPPGAVSMQLRRHELQHVYQLWALGPWRFYAGYLWLLLRHGYRRHPFEIEARACSTELFSAEEWEVFEP